MPVSFVPAASDFHAQHSPFGAFASFTLGRYGRQGGFGLEIGGAATQDVYIAVVRSTDDEAGHAVKALPFFTNQRHSGAESYGVADATEDFSGWTPYAPEEITRSMGWATDSWATSDGLSFRLITPFGRVPDPLTISNEEIRSAVCPAILAEISVNNEAHAFDAWAFFGIGGDDALRPLSDTDRALKGVARDTVWGFAAKSEAAVQESLSWELPRSVIAVNEPQPIHRLSNRGGLLLHVPAGESKTYTIALGFYRSGVVTTGVSASYLYTRLFDDLEHVLEYALGKADEWKNIASERDTELDAAPINESRQFLLAHATHSYHGSTMLLHDEKGDLLLSPKSSRHHPLWVVNEGEYRMMNTLDLTLDHAFWELRFHPWTLRNTLDLFAARYRYYDETQDATDPSRPRYPGGVAFTRDMGVANQFSPQGFSAFERPNRDAGFSYMTTEELLNWCLSAALYAITTEDHYWLGLRREIFVSCLHSLLSRDGPDGIRNGIIALDSARCQKGQEINGYDALDSKVGQARSNGYIAVKTWAAYLALGRCFHRLGHTEAAALSEEQAALTAQAISGHFDHQAKYLPAIFEQGNPGAFSRMIPAIEALVFPYLLGDHDAVSEDGPFGEMISLLRSHLVTVLQSGVCVDAVSGGIKISSTSPNTWMSKIFLSQWVAESIFGIRFSDPVDAAHAKWQTQGSARDFAFTDRVRSDNGDDYGSRFCPRGVTSILWMRDSAG